MLRDCTEVTIAFGEVIQASGQTLTHIYLPTTAVIALLAVAPGSGSVAAAIASKQGAAGICGLYGRAESPWQMVTQLPGGAFRIPVGLFETHLQRSPSLAAIARRNMGLLIGAVAETAVCGRLHTLEQRSARWLTAVDELAESRPFPATGELLAQVLGARRPSVSAVLSNFVTRELLAREDLRMLRVRDRDALNALACDRGRLMLIWR